MVKKYIQRFLPDQNKLKQGWYLRIFGRFSQHSNLWHLNRRSASGAVAVGLFIAFLPLPGQMLMAAGLAILFRVHLPTSVALVWITNPITITPVMYAAYKVGVSLLGKPTAPFSFEWTFEWLFHSFTTALPPILIGSLIFSVVSATMGYIVTRILWRLLVQNAWLSRLKIRKKRAIELEKQQRALIEQHDKQDK